MTPTKPTQPSSVWLELVTPRDDVEIEFAPELPNETNTVFFSKK